MYYAVCFKSIVLFLGISSLSYIYTQSIDLLKVESDIIKGLEKYINDYEAQINKLKDNLKELQKEHEEANEDVTKYLSNPINAYLLTKRLTTDWKHVEELINADKNLEFFKNLTTNFGREQLPNEEDLRNEILRLDRLRKTYNLPLRDVANGYLDGVRYSDPLKTIDCFEIGRQLYMSELYESADEWLTLALSIFDDESFPNMDDGELARASILDYLAMSKLNIGDYDKAMHFALEALKIYPEFDHINDNIRKIRRAMAEERSAPKTTAGTKIKKDKKKKGKDNKYEEGCRGELKKSPTQVKELYCEYLSENLFFRKMSPYKVEYLNLNPKIMLIYDILSENEIEKFMKISEGKMETATIIDQYRGIEVAYPTLSSQYFVLDDNDIPLVNKLDQRLSDVTGLVVKTEGENLQISTYDVGGYYEPPQELLYQVGDKPFTLSEKLGNRIASAIIYLNDVEKGGATVFPKIDTVVFPHKGAALFWYNIFQNGTVDSDVQHAGCPVLKGNKWILQKWIREREQMMAKPCKNENDRFN